MEGASSFLVCAGKSSSSSSKLCIGRFSRVDLNRSLTLMNEPLTSIALIETRIVIYKNTLTRSKCCSCCITCFNSSSCFLLSNCYQHHISHKHIIFSNTNRHLWWNTCSKSRTWNFLCSSALRRASSAKAIWRVTSNFCLVCFSACSAASRWTLAASSKCLQYSTWVSIFLSSKPWEWYVDATDNRLNTLMAFWSSETVART